MSAPSLSDPPASWSFATVFVDRDGVLNRKPRKYLLSPSRLELLPGAAAAVRALNASNKHVYVVTNQRCVALGLLSVEVLEQIHANLRELLAKERAHVDGIYVCPHAAGVCDCRKPLPGLLGQAQRDHPEIDFARSVLIGDSPVDVEAGAAAGCRTVLIGRGRRRAEALAQLRQPPDATGVSLLDATRKLLGGRV